MTETVRVAIAEELPPLDWPPCCAQCETKGALVAVGSRLGRVKSVRPNWSGGLTLRSDILYLSFPMCRQHAGATAWANRILGNSPVAGLIRMIVYGGLLFVLPLLIRPARFVADVGWFSLYPLLGVAGVAAIVWAKWTAAVLPVRFDPDMDVVEIRFRNEDYATKFRIFNRKATSSSLTEALPWYKRALPWKIVVLGLFFAFMAKLVAR